MQQLETNNKFDVLQKYVQDILAGDVFVRNIITEGALKRNDMPILE